MKLINEGTIEFFSLYEKNPHCFINECKILSKEDYERIVRKAIWESNKFKCNIRIYDEPNIESCAEFLINEYTINYLDVVFGTLVFYKNKLYSNIIFHECSHAIFELFKRKQQKVNDRLLLIKNINDEELILHFIDSLYYSTIRYLWEYKFIDKIDNWYFI